MYIVTPVCQIEGGLDPPGAQQARQIVDNFGLLLEAEVQIPRLHPAAVACEPIDRMGRDARRCERRRKPLPGRVRAGDWFPCGNGNVTSSCMWLAPP